MGLKSITDSARAILAHENGALRRYFWLLLVGGCAIYTLLFSLPKLQPSSTTFTFSAIKTPSPAIFTFLAIKGLFQSNFNKIPDPLSQPITSPPSPDEILSPVRFPKQDQMISQTRVGLTYYPNGHVSFNISKSPHQTHPITILIERAKIEWEAKLARQSKSLKEAVQEYKRRYRRNPPAGFEHWYTYAIEKGVQLIDEYDQITRDLLPLWALSPTELRARSEELMNRDDIHHFSLDLSDSSLNAGGTDPTNPHAVFLITSNICNDFMPLYQRIGLPPVSIAVRGLDEPRILLGWQQQERLFELANSGKFLKEDEQFEGVEVYDAFSSNINSSWDEDWAKHCPPDSGFKSFQHNQSSSYPVPVWGDHIVQSSNHSFIFHHRRAMDLCMNPDYVDIHSGALGRAWTPTPMIPIFSPSKTSVHADILIIPYLFNPEEGQPIRTPWAKRPHNTLYWRGSASGPTYSKHNLKWNTSQRIRLHQFSHNPKPNVRVLSEENPELNSSSAKFQNQITEFEASSELLNWRYLNISLTEKPMQCDPNECEKISELIDFGPRSKHKEEEDHKYLLDVDGNGWSARFRRLLATEHVVVKSSIMPEWYTDRIQPWYHYVPSKVDYSDLYDIMSYFTGGLDGTGGHEEEAEKIAKQGQTWTELYYTSADMGAYMFRLFLEYNRIYHRAENGTSADFDDTFLS